MSDAVQVTHRDALRVQVVDVDLFVFDALDLIIFNMVRTLLDLPPLSGPTTMSPIYAARRGRSAVDAATQTPVARRSSRTVQCSS